MSDAYITQIGDPKMKDISFEDRFALLVDIEYNNRKSNGLKRLIRKIVSSIFRKFVFHSAAGSYPASV